MKLCVCNGCNSLLLDKNPKADAPDFPEQLDVKEMEWIMPAADEDGPFWGCPDCTDDGLLMDYMPEKENHYDLLYQVWFNTFRPIKNHLDNNASHDGHMFETYGTELDYVQAIHKTTPDRVWTVLDADGDTYIASGYHHVNRLGYLITDVEYSGTNPFDFPYWKEEWHTVIFCKALINHPNCPNGVTIKELYHIQSVGDMHFDSVVHEEIETLEEEGKEVTAICQTMETTLSDGTTIPADTPHVFWLPQNDNIIQMGDDWTGTIRQWLETNLFGKDVEPLNIDDINKVLSLSIDESTTIGLFIIKRIA